MMASPKGKRFCVQFCRIVERPFVRGRNSISMSSRPSLRLASAIGLARIWVAASHCRTPGWMAFMATCMAPSRILAAWFIATISTEDLTARTCRTRLCAGCTAALGSHAGGRRRYDAAARSIRSRHLSGISPAPPRDHVEDEIQGMPARSCGKGGGRIVLDNAKIEQRRLLGGAATEVRTDPDRLVLALLDGRYWGAGNDGPP